jgi:hypothetical protein
VKQVVFLKKFLAQLKRRLSQKNEGNETKEDGLDEDTMDVGVTNGEIAEQACPFD